jgi:hypothetical protein
VAIGAGGEYLPPVVTELTADISDLIRKVEEAKALLAQLGGFINIGVRLELEQGSVTKLTAQLAVVRAALARMMQIPVTFDVNMASFLRALAMAAMLRDAIGGGGGGIVPYGFGTGGGNNDQTRYWAWIISHGNGGNGNGGGGGPIPLPWSGGGGNGGGGGTAATLALVTASFRGLGNIIHWVIAGGAELLAVLGPALVALGAAAMVLAQGFGNIYVHLTSLYTATEATANMFHQTIGSVLGLHSALQAAQNVANPIAYSVLGAAVMVLQSHFQGLAQTGLEVSRVFQTFVAKLVTEFQGSLGGQVQGLLSNMVGYLIQFAQILGNLVHALVNFAGAMPGLAHVLLGIVDAASRLILWLSQLPHWLITTAMLMEEIWRWGPLAGSAFMLLGRGIALIGSLGIPVLIRFAAVIKTIFTGLLVEGVAGFLGNVGMLIGKLNLLGPASEGAVRGIYNLKNAITGAVETMPTWGWFAVGAAIIGGFFLVKTLAAASATQQLVTSMQNATNAASGLNVFSKTAANISALSSQLTTVNQGMRGLASNTAALAVNARGAGAVYRTMASDAATLNAGIRQQQQDTRNAAQAVDYLSKAFGTSFAGALAIGDAAGIRWDAGVGKMSATAEQNLVKIDMLRQGYLAMGAPTSAVGKDMTALGIQAALQATRVQQLTQAWQAWMQLLTGGTSGLAQFENSLANIGQGIATVTNNLAESASGTFSAKGVAQFAKDLTSFTGQGSQAWQNFNQVVAGSAEQFINWMQTAGAAGVVSGGQMTQAIKGVVLQLLPFASQSAAARAELTGLIAQTGATVPPTMAAIKAWAAGGMSASQLGRFVAGATVKLSNMQQVASTLNAVMGDVSATFAKARIAVSGLDANMGPLITAVQKYGATSSQAHTAMIPVIGSLKTLGLTVPEISGYLLTLGIHESNAAIKAIIAGHDFQTMGGQAQTASAKVQALVRWINSLHNKSITITTNFVSRGGSYAGIGGIRIHNASGTANAPPGMSWVGEHGPELVYFHGGEGVINAGQTGAAMAAANGGGQEHHTHVYIDGKELFKGVKSATYTYNVNNRNRGPGGRVSGTMVPGKRGL